MAECGNLIKTPEWKQTSYWPSVSSLLGLPLEELDNHSKRRNNQHQTLRADLPPSHSHFSQRVQCQSLGHFVTPLGITRLAQSDTSSQTLLQLAPRSLPALRWTGEMTKHNIRVNFEHISRLEEVWPFLCQICLQSHLEFDCECCL